MRYSDMTPEQKAAQDKADRREYNLLAAINIILLLAFLAFGISAIVCVFRANWPYALGFAILTYIFIWIYRRVPLPMTRQEKALHRVRQQLARFR